MTSFPALPVATIIAQWRDNPLSERGGANRKVLDRTVDTARIFEAWSDKVWVNEGAAVGVSLVCFTTTHPQARHPGESRGPVAASTAVLDSGLPAAPGMTARLDGQAVAAIHADLTGGADNITQAKPLPENANTAYLGIQAGDGALGTRPRRRHRLRGNDGG
jgi:hypothetical protein